VSARLVDVRAGAQLWSERFEGRIEDVFDLQDRMASQIAEALRVRIAVVLDRGDVSAELVDTYLRARTKLAAAQVVTPGGALELFEKCLEMDPDFAPAIAMHAIACVRAFFLPNAARARDWRSEAERSVERARVMAPQLAESHHAAAMLAVNTGRYRDAIQSLQHALSIAPTYTNALHYLAMLECETGRADEGVRRHNRAYELDPTLAASMLDVGRVSALQGKMPEYHKAIRKLTENNNNLTQMPTILLQTRVATWLGDMGRVRELVELTEDSTEPAMLYARGYGLVVLGDQTPEDFRALMQNFLPQNPSMRFRALIEQIGTELYMARGQNTDALDSLERANEACIVDIEWLNRCPLLEPIRKEPRYQEVRKQMRERVREMWTAAR